MERMELKCWYHSDEISDQSEVNKALNNLNSSGVSPADIKVVSMGAVAGVFGGYIRATIHYRHTHKLI